MGAHQISFDPDGLLHLHLEGEFSSEEFLAMLRDLEAQLDQATSSLCLIMTRRRFGFPPTDGQMEAGRVLRHPNLLKLAVVGSPQFGRAVSDVISSVAKGKYFHYFESEDEARAFLLDPNAPAPEG